MAQWVARFAGSPLFLASHALLFGGWMIFNAVAGRPPFDPPPFHLLGLLVGIEALVLSCFVLMNQSREDRAQAIRNDEEYRVNVAAEREVAFFHQRLDDMQREILSRLPNTE